MDQKKFFYTRYHIQTIFTINPHRLITLRVNTQYRSPPLALANIDVNIIFLNVTVNSTRHVIVDSRQENTMIRLMKLLN